MRKAWAVLALVLLIGIQVTALSLFHQVDASGPAYGNTDVCVAKWDYVLATVQVAITSDQVAPVEVTLPNGTGTAVTSGATYDITLSLPRTGDFMGNAGVYIGTTTALTESDPIVASIDSNVTSIPFSHPCAQLEGSQYVDETNIMVSGFADVSVTGYGVAL